MYSCSLSEGIWEVTSVALLSSTDSGSTYNHQLKVGDNEKVVRTSCKNGGGSSVCSIVKIDSPSTLSVSIYSPMACNAYGQINAIKLK